MGGTVTFTDTSTGSPVAWLWDFGDGDTSALQNPVHVYAADGVYTVTLDVFGSGGSHDQTTQDVAIDTVTDIVLEYV